MRTWRVATVFLFVWLPLSLPVAARTYDNTDYSQTLMSDAERLPAPAGSYTAMEATSNGLSDPVNTHGSTAVGGNYDLSLMSSVLGVYVCQAVIVNALFTILATISQKIQEMLDIDTGAMLLGQLAGILTVAMGGYTAYKASELLVQLLLVRLTSIGALKRGNDLLAVLRERDDHSITAPIKAISTIGQALRIQRTFEHGMKKLVPLIGPTAMVARQEVMGPRHAQATVMQLRSPVMRPQIREVAMIAIYCLSTFALLGGRLHSFTPSDISHPGAFAAPSLSLLADGYNYANKKQKHIIQEVGRTYGCHTCGHISHSDRYIADHQPPSGVVKRKLKRGVVKFLLDHRIVPESLLRPRQYFYPHCQGCSAMQAKAVRNNRKKVVTHYGVLRPYYLCASGYLVGRLDKAVHIPCCFRALMDTRWVRRRGFKRR